MAAERGRRGSKSVGQWRSLQPPMPGLDAARVAALYDALAREFEPAAAMEECWLNDVAQLTARIEGLRHIVHQFYVARMIHLTGDDTFMVSVFDDEECEFLRDSARKHFEIERGFGSEERNCIARLMSAAFVRHIDKFRMFEEIERGLLRERDRIVAQFERRRRDQLAAAVRAADLKARPALPSPAAGAD